MKLYITKTICLLMIGVAILLPHRLQAEDPKTEIQYLTGRGPKDAVPWDFKIEGGRRSGEATTIPVPSNWELHGFGNYTFGLACAQPPEIGFYKKKFTVPESWAGRRINLVFNGVMSDTTVKVNGRSAGPTHIGSFYQFKYDITRFLKKEKGAENLLEVEVAKISSDPETQKAEQHGDYWVFGGIFRPVWLEALPDRCIEHVAINALADGKLSADLTLGFRGPIKQDGTKLVPETIEAQILDAKGQLAGEPFTQAIPAGGIGRMRISMQLKAPALWTAETPHLYSLSVSRKSADQVVHTITKRFGFRTFEVRDGQGLFLNGQRILLKGASRHSIRPNTGRAMDAEDCYADVRLIKSMNMNAVRMTSYSPDEAALEACDELGLYVLDELGGWGNAYNTEVGRRLVREMVERDVNHPSILFWNNGNESGWNRDLDGDFALYDPQQRRVLHPWDPFCGVDALHYPPYGDLVQHLTGPNLVMPTEFQHDLYDGGGGAGLEDYWNAITDAPFGAGGFIWALADEGVRRDDQNGRIDAFGTFSADGVVGPNHEKEGSYYTVRDVWSPVQIAKPVIDDKFTRNLTVTNHYDFTSLEQCRFQWKLLRYPSPTEVKTPPQTLAEGNAPSPAIPPHGRGELAVPLPANWREADALSLVAFGPDKQELWNWVWPLPGITRQADSTKAGEPKVETATGEIRLSADGLTASFDATSGLLKTVKNGDKTFAVSNGPRLAFAKPTGPVDWLPFASVDEATHTYRLASPHLASTAQVEMDFKIKSPNTGPYASYKLEISPDGKTWKTLFDGSCRIVDLKNSNFAPQIVAAVRISNANLSDGQALGVKSVRLGYATADYPAESTTPATITSGHGKAPKTGKPIAWLESKGTAGLNHFRWVLSGDGSLRLDYNYTLNGEYRYHGITFDHPEDQMKSLRWLGEGPYRVWQNRLRGTWLGIHETAYNDIQPGESWDYPEFQGFYSGLRWANLETLVGRLTVTSASPEVYLRVGSPRISHEGTTVAFPAGDLSVLHAIPGVGSKINNYSPTAQPAKANGDYHGTLTFTFAETRTEGVSKPSEGPHSKFPDRAELTTLLPTARVGKDDKKRIIGVMQSALQGNELMIMGIGTSIMAGANAADFKKTSLSPLVYDWWVSKFPMAKIKFINAGMGASSAVYAVHRAERDILKFNPDFTVIDYTASDRNFEPEGLEGLIRKMFIQRPQSAMISIIQGGQTHTKVPEVHVAICENYGIPMLSVPQIFQPMLKSGRLEWKDWSTDTIHPSDAGHQMIADLIISYLELCYKEATTSASPIKIGELKPPVTQNGFAKSAVHDASSLTPDDSGNWTPYRDSSGWNNSWAANSEGQPMVFKVKAKSLIFGYRKTIKLTNGKLIIKMDGQQHKEIDPNFKNGWGDWVPNETVFKTDLPEEHTIEFSYSGSPGEPILIKYLLIAE